MTPYPDNPDMIQDFIVERADEAIEAIGDTMIRDMMIKARDRRGFAVAAANIAEDRYGAGSTAARCTVAILLKHGVDAALAFAEDLEHHER